jgi:formylglycine-generating enzyme required for sulfatase activity
VQGKIFISYRRDDAPADARGIHDALARAFGKSNVFMDVDNLLAGQRFDKELEKALSQCDVLIAIIGLHWMQLLSARAQGTDGDYVLDEIAAALKRGIVVIPVRVGQEGKLPPLPRREELPEGIRDLLLHQKHDVTHERFHRDVADLAKAISIVRKGDHKRWPAGLAAVGVVAAALMIGVAVVGYRWIDIENPRRMAELEARQRAEAEAARKALEEETRRRAQEEAKRKADEEATRKAGEDAKRKADDEARRKAEEEAHRKAEVDAKRKADEDARRKAEEDARKKAEEEARRKAEEGRERAEAEARRDPALALTPGSGQSFRDRLADGQPCPMCPELVVVPAGSFTMGSPASEEGRFNDEEPQHMVSFAKPFAVGRFAVTFDEWEACVADDGCLRYQPGDQFWGRRTRPVINVSWTHARAYTEWLSRKTRKRYQLLSEAQREYVTRSGTPTPYWFGWSISSDQANYQDQANKTVLVDTFAPNPWGLYQVHGNVWEWTEDCYHPNYNGAPTDGTPWTAGDCRGGVVRGGSWKTVSGLLRSAARSSNTFSYRSDNIGFRVSRMLAPN